MRFSNCNTYDLEFEGGARIFTLKVVFISFLSESVVSIKLSIDHNLENR